MKKILVIILVLFSAVWLKLSIEEKPNVFKVPKQEIRTVLVRPNQVKRIPKKFNDNDNEEKLQKQESIVREMDKKTWHPQAELVKKLKAEKIIQVTLEDGLAIAYGDVVLGEVEMDSVNGNSPNLYIESSAIHLWESNKIPYYIEPDLPNKNEVEKAIVIINKMTAVELIPLETSHVDGIVFKSGKKNCYSYLGKTGGIQPIMLAPSCKAREILHEIMHALGFIHEQSRSDRDDYVTVIWENIQPEYYGQFQIVPDNYMITVEGSDFDFSSIMLYQPSLFAKKEGLLTMKPMGAKKFENSLDFLSKIDVERIDRIYAR